MQRPRRGVHVVGVDGDRVVAHLLVRPGLAGEHQRAAVLGEHRHLLGDQVHAVADGVDQRHVGQPVRGQRAGEVVLEVEHHRRPVRRAVLRVDLLGDPRHLRGVVPVDGEVLPRGVGEGHVHDPVAPLGVVVEQLPEGVQAADDVLGELGAVHPHDRLPRVPVGVLADLGAQLRHALVDVGLMGPLAQEVGVGAEAVHADPGVAEAADDGVAAGGEGVGPALGEEAQAVGAQHAAQHRLRDVVGQQPEVLRRGPGSVREVPDAQVGAELAEHAGGQRQVVVLDQHRRALGGLLGQRLGERPVVLLVGGPLDPELGVEHRFDGGLVEHVVHEPEHRVGDAVVRRVMGLGGDVEHLHARFAHPAPDGLAVPFAQRRADPQGAGVRADRGESGDHPATAPPGDQRAVPGDRVGDRAAVGRDQYLCRSFGGTHTRHLARRRKIQTCVDHPVTTAAPRARTGRCAERVGSGHFA